MRKNKILLLIIIFFGIGGFVAYKMYNKPHINVVKTKSEIVLTANKIIKDFSLDEVAANKKYVDKIVEVKGVISEIKIKNETRIITLKTNDEFGSVLCHLSKSSTKKTDNLKIGQTIVIKGICTGFLMDVILIKCEIKNE